MLDCQGNFLTEGGLGNVYLGLKNKVNLKSKIEL